MNYSSAIREKFIRQLWHRKDTYKKVLFIVDIIIASDEGDDYVLPLNTTAEYLVSENPTTGDLRFITVRIIDDDNYEGDHTFMMMIKTSSPAVTMVGGSATIIIQDDNGRCIIIYTTSLIGTDMLFCSRCKCGLTLRFCCL